MVKDWTAEVNAGAPTKPDGADSHAAIWPVVVSAWIVSRLVVGVAWLITQTGWFERFSVDDVQTQHGLLLWDGTWYRDLATTGYDPERSDMQRFFPLYHLLGRVVGTVIGNPTAGLIFVSNAAALVLFWAMYRLVRSAGFGERIAARSVWWLALFPAGATLVWGYSEPIAMLVGVCAVWAVLEQRWVAGVAAGLLVGLSRSVGVVLCVALLAAAAQWLVERWRAEDSPRLGEFIKRHRGYLVGAGAVIVSPVAGFVGYFMWLRSTFGSWDAPLESQRGFRAGWRDPFTRLIEGVIDVASGSGADIFNVGFALATLGGLIIAARRVPWWASAYVGVTLVVALAANNINSLGRYVLAAFPIALIIAVDEAWVLERTGWNRRVVVITTSSVSSALMVAYCLWAWSGRMIP